MKGKKTIYCHFCSGEIKSRDDLVVTDYFFRLVPYHSKCFANRLKSMETIFIDNKPVNGTMANVWVGIAIVFGTITLLIPETRYYSILFFLYLPIRLYSWLKFERHL